VVIDGIDYPIEAVAIDPNTTLPGMVTEIDRRYFSRFILPVAAEFVSGVADAVGDSGTTTVFLGEDTTAVSTFDKDITQEIGSGISEAGDKLADILDEEASRIQPMLRIAAGTPVGVLFLAPVTDLAQSQ
jgi:intracellular multiplication protein IcmE